MTVSPNPELSGIFVYPVKSCAGLSVAYTEIGERGIAFDRHWVVAGKNGRFLTQRECPRMALIVPQVAANGTLRLTAAEYGSCSTGADDDHHRQAICSTVRIWSDCCQAQDEGDSVAAWLTDYLQTQCRLYRIATDDSRLAHRRLPDGEPVRISFVDSSPFLVISEASLNDLNGRLPESIPMNRFRPNLVIRGLPAYAEDSIEAMEIGEMSFFKGKQCSRCVITTIDQTTAQKGGEPLRTLSTYRRVSNKVMFGTYFLHTKPGQLCVGSPVVVLQPSRF